MATYQIVASNTQLDNNGAGNYLVAADSAGNWYALRQSTSGSGDWEVYYSEDNGATWASLGDINLSTTRKKNGIFITPEDQLFAFGEGTTTGDIRIRAWDLNTADPSTSTDRGSTTYIGGSSQQYGNIVAYRDGTDDYVVIASTVVTDWGIRVWKLTSADVWSHSGATYSTTNDVYNPMVELEHTGDGITPPSSPDLYLVGNKNSGSAEKIFVKMTYSSAGVWTMGTERTILSGTAYYEGKPVYHQPDDEVLMFFRNSSDYKIYVSKRDAADTTTNALTTSAAGDATFHNIGVEYRPGDATVRLFQWGSSSEEYHITYDIDADSWGSWSSDLNIDRQGQGIGIAHFPDLLGWSVVVYEETTSADFDIDTLQELVYNSILTDPALSLTSTLYTDSFARAIADPALSLTSTLYTDVLLQFLTITDNALAGSPTLYTDVLDATRYLTDPQLQLASTLYTDALGGLVDPSPWWLWRFVRQNGQLFLVPLKARHAWDGEAVSSDFRINSDLLQYTQQRVTSAWATHSGSSAATLKAAIDTALGGAGFVDKKGNPLT